MTEYKDVERGQKNQSWITIDLQQHKNVRSYNYKRRGMMDS